MRKGRRRVESAHAAPNITRGTQFFVFDETRQRVLGVDYWPTNMRGQLGRYLGNLYYFDLYVAPDGGRDPSGGTVAGDLFVKRAEPVSDRSYFAFTFPGEPFYRDRELCHVHYYSPIPLHHK